MQVSAAIEERDGQYENLVYARILTTQSACVDGDDLAACIRPFKLDDMVHFCRYHRSNMAKLRQYLEDDREFVDSVRGDCRWAMKLCLRAGFELVMFRLGKWTNDLYPCAKQVAIYYPERAPLAEQTLWLAINPTSDVDAITRVVDDWHFIYEEMGKHLGVASDLDSP